MNNADIKEPVTIDNNSGKVLPCPKGIKLKTIDDVRVEMASVFNRQSAIKVLEGLKVVDPDSTKWFADRLDIRFDD